MIGCGDVTEKKSGPAFSKVFGSELVAVMRRNGQAAADYARRHGVPRWYDDASALIADPEVDAVYVATPPDTHAYYTNEAAASGKPVYVEKPMARTVAECEGMISSCKQAGVPLFVAYYRRCLPHFVQAREWLAQGRIGQILAVQMSLFLPPPAEATDWRFDMEKAGGGLLYDLGSHQFDALDYLLGPIAEVQGRARNLAGRYAVEDTVSARWSFESGVEGGGLWCFVTDTSAQRDEITILGSKGSVTLACFGKIETTLMTVDGPVLFEAPAPDHVQEGLITTIVQELRGEGVAASTGESALRTARVIEAIASGPNP